MKIFRVILGNHSRLHMTGSYLHVTAPNIDACSYGWPFDDLLGYSSRIERALVKSKNHRIWNLERINIVK